MSEIHFLTDKEEKAIGDAISVVKKFGKYIENVNLTNEILRSNLDEAIKAGDVTNVQKVNLRIYEQAEKLGKTLRKNIKAKCDPECPCSKQEQDRCTIARAYWVADILCRVANGDEMGWEEAFFRLLHEMGHEEYFDFMRSMRFSHCCREGAEIYR